MVTEQKITTSYVREEAVKFGYLKFMLKMFRRKCMADNWICQHEGQKDTQPGDSDSHQCHMECRAALFISFDKASHWNEAA